MLMYNKYNLFIYDTCIFCRIINAFGVNGKYTLTASKTVPILVTLEGLKTWWFHQSLLLFGPEELLERML